MSPPSAWPATIRMIAIPFTIDITVLRGRDLLAVATEFSILRPNLAIFFVILQPPHHT